MRCYFSYYITCSFWEEHCHRDIWREHPSTILAAYFRCCVLASLHGEGEAHEEKCTGTLIDEALSKLDRNNMEKNE